MSAVAGKFEIGQLQRSSFMGHLAFTFAGNPTRTTNPSMLALGGFNEALYPNEENALMDEMQKRGAKLLYDPDLIVHRRPRHSLKAFAKMLLTYGRGRAEQFRLHPSPGSALNFLPPLFLLYLLAMIVSLLLGLLLVLLIFIAATLCARIGYQERSHCTGRK